MNSWDVNLLDLHPHAPRILSSTNEDAAERDAAERRRRGATVREPQPTLKVVARERGSYSEESAARTSSRRLWYSS